MLNSDVLVFEYFKKKGSEWASKKGDPLSYLESKSPEEISSEFKSDGSFKQVTSYIDSIENKITENLEEKNLKEITKRIDSKYEEDALKMIKKLIDAIKKATNYEDLTDNQKENKKYSAIALTASIATAVLLSGYKKLEKPKRKIKLYK